eukprot:111831-Chlamydomonas_euryale.AAC.4
MEGKGADAQNGRERGIDAGWKGKGNRCRMEGTGATAQGRERARAQSSRQRSRFTGWQEERAGRRATRSATVASPLT